MILLRQASCKIAKKRRQAPIPFFFASGYACELRASDHGSLPMAQGSAPLQSSSTGLDSWHAAVLWIFFIGNAFNEGDDRNHFYQV